jgi:hypothetical protein
MEMAESLKGCGCGGRVIKSRARRELSTRCRSKRKQRRDLRYLAGHDSCDLGTSQWDAAKLSVSVG